MDGSIPSHQPRTNRPDFNTQIKTAHRDGEPFFYANVDFESHGSRSLSTRQDRRRLRPAAIANPAIARADGAGTTTVTKS